MDETRLLLEDRVELPRLYISWLTPAMFAGGDADLDLAADILANGKTSRLYKRLVFDERIATDVRRRRTRVKSPASCSSRRPAAPGHTLLEIERVMVEEISRLAADGPTPDEMDRAKMQAEVQFVFRLQSVGGFGGKSDQLNAYNTFLGDPAFFDRDLQRYRDVTSSSLQAAVRGFCDHGRRVVLSVVPGAAPISRCPIQRRR